MGRLPDHLESSDSFLQRYRELTGPDIWDLRSGEVVRTIRANRNNPEASVQKKFEDDTARILAAILLMKFTHTPRLRIMIEQQSGIAGFSREEGDSFLKTKEGIRVRLPRSHAGVVQVAPVVSDILKRLSETRGPHNWENNAFIHANSFNNFFTHHARSMIYHTSPKRVFSSIGRLSDGISALETDMQGNKRIKKGFGAMILSSISISSYPDSELHAVIDAAPRLLAKGGTLFINDLEQFLDRNASVWDMIDRARQVFNSEPVQLGEWAQPSGHQGRQAAFVKM